MRFLEEGRSTHRELMRLLDECECAGVAIHDANVVATALVHRVPGIVTENQSDFARFGQRVNVVPLQTIG